MPPNLKTRSATSHLKRLARSLASLAEQDRQQAARLSAHLSLAAAGLCPAPLDRKLIETLNRLIHGPQASLHYDASDFAGLTESFHLNFASRKSEVWEQLGNLPRQLQYTRQALADPLFTGNLWEFLPEFLPPPKSPQSKLKDNRSKDPTKSPTSKHTYNQADKQANNQEYNQASYLANNLADTQFFTPLWIAGDMAASLNLSGQQTVLDPACGAGHLLVAVLEAALSQSLRRGEAAQAALAGLLKDRLFGLDVDSRMLDLSGLALYIAARKHCSGELPRPNLQKLALPLGSLDRALWQSDSAPDSPVKGIRGFDNLIMNPPYQSSRTMDSITADYLKQHYPNTKNDLYAAFLELALTLLKEEGRLTTITQQSFFQYSALRAAAAGTAGQSLLYQRKSTGSRRISHLPGREGEHRHSHPGKAKGQARLARAPAGRPGQLQLPPLQEGKDRRQNGTTQRD
ncbi:MAG: N-6 DNA methylase [Candidatus Melainabacteria bacterium]|nr:N-6 DNA methylase [Candidatus Melainabacteria bacterium]